MKRDHAIALLVAIVSAAIFFAAAFSSEPNLLKAPVMLADLVFSGMLLTRLLEVPGWYGVVLLRGKNGLSLMNRVGDRFPVMGRRLADFGFVLAFGLPYSARLFLKDKRKLEWAVDAAIVLAFFLWLQTVPASSSWLNSWAAFFVGTLFGLAGIGLFSLIVSAAGILAEKSALSSVAPVVPGITLPLAEGLVAMAIVVAVHELAHGVLARIERIPVSSSGLLLFGFLPIGAFVEPDEGKLKKASAWKKRRVLIAGSTSNFFFFFLFLALTLGLAASLGAISTGVGVGSIPAQSPAIGTLTEGMKITAIAGVPVNSAQEDYDALQAAGNLPVSIQTDSGKFTVNASSLLLSDVRPGGPADGKLGKGDIITEVDGKPVNSTLALQQALSSKPPGSTFLISSQRGSVGIRTGVDGKIGISVSSVPAFVPVGLPRPGWEEVWKILLFLLTTAGIAALLNLAIAIVNVLPVFITDGHHLLAAEFEELLGGPKKRRTAALITSIAGLAVLALVLINLGRWFKLF